MPTDPKDSITPKKTRQSQRRSTSEVHVHPQVRTPSLQDKPIPDLSPPIDQRQVSGGIAPSKRNVSIGSPLKGNTDESTAVGDIPGPDLAKDDEADAVPTPSYNSKPEGTEDSGRR